ncbi:MAG: cupin domain-containing protein [bacterium]
MEAQVHNDGVSEEYFFEEGCYITELLNLPVDPLCSVARARVPVGVTTQSHFLEETTERYVIERGKGALRLANEPVRQVGAGDIIVIPPGCHQSIANVGEEDLVFLAICTPRFVSENYRVVLGP